MTKRERLLIMCAEKYVETLIASRGAASMPRPDSLRSELQMAAIKHQCATNEYYALESLVEAYDWNEEETP